MTHEDFFTIYLAEEENIIVNSRIEYRDNIVYYGNYYIISPEIELQFHKWLDNNPLLKALR